MFANYDHGMLVARSTFERILNMMCEEGGLDMVFSWDQEIMHYMPNRKDARGEKGMFELSVVARVSTTSGQHHSIVAILSMECCDDLHNWHPNFHGCQMAIDGENRASAEFDLMGNFKLRKTVTVEFEKLIAELPK